MIISKILMKLVTFFSLTYQFLRTHTVLGNYWVKAFLKMVILGPDTVPRHDNTILNPPGDI